MDLGSGIMKGKMYKTINWNTSSNRSPKPVDKKKIKKYADAWAKANGYKLQAPSFKRLKKDTIMN